MAINTKQGGSVEVIYGQKYTGINTQAPPNLIADSDAVDVKNFMLRNGEIRSRPRFIPWTLDVGTPDVLTGCGSFLSPQRFYHTFAFDAAGALYNLQGSNNTLVPVASLTHLASTDPVAWRIFNSVLYWVNGAQSVGSWDGLIGAGGITSAGVGAGGAGYVAGDTGTVTTGDANATYTVLTVSAGAVLTFQITALGSGYTASNGNATAITTGAGNGAFTIDIFTIGAGALQDVVKVDGGATIVGARYLDVLDQHVILANTVGNASDGPFTIRWSAVGLPTQFDPTLNVNAGFNIFIDFADEISGMMMLGRVGYLFHRTGITEMAPTGVGTAPFDFNHIWNSQDGTGNIFPNTIAQYGATGAFVSTENIYSVQNYQFAPIGANARDSIMADLALAEAGPGSPKPIGAILPGYASNFVYLTYQLYIPLADGGPTIMWQYSFEDQSWQRYVLSPVQVSGIPAFCLVS